MAEAGSTDPLAVTFRSHDRVVLVPRPTTPEEGMALIRQHVGQGSHARRRTPVSGRLGVTDVRQHPHRGEVFSKVYRQPGR
ncbi:hypothetical protein [Mesorhizobium sp. M1348]|uniref:hypothetical protein n=1 Tax=Mesorhizobium sp. M1348 TaxID=2957089 RepID=UPI003339F6E4